VDNVDSRNGMPAHIAHSPDYDGGGPVFDCQGSSELTWGGPLFGKQVALFSIDKNKVPSGGSEVSSQNGTPSGKPYVRLFELPSQSLLYQGSFVCSAQWSTHR
jgi:hypothetical protein